MGDRIFTGLAIALAVGFFGTRGATADAGVSSARVIAGRPHWTQLSPELSPPTRFFATMAFDPIDKGLILFGGQGESARLNDTWRWTGSAWENVTPAVSPSPRQDAAMAYDPMTRQLVLFSGEGCATGYCHDTWVWAHRTWTRMHPGHSPPGRVGSMMAYDRTTQQLLLFGGDNATCNPGQYAECLHTWSWNGQDWVLVDAHGPATGGFGAMSYDPHLGTVVLYGGDNTNDTRTWEWTGSAWNEAATTGPCNTSYDSMAPDVNGSVILFGGYGSCPFQNTTEKWTGTEWITLPETVAPSPRGFAVMAYDPLSKQTLLFGGSGQNGAYDDTWTFG